MPIGAERGQISTISSVASSISTGRPHKVNDDCDTIRQFIERTNNTLGPHECPDHDADTAPNLQTRWQSVRHRGERETFREGCRLVVDCVIESDFFQACG